jgi:cupin fold WbuC family metalloprotein
MRENEHAFLNDQSVLAVDTELVEELKRRAWTAPHRRFRLCLHHSPADAVQEMIVVHCRENYSRPHRHPGLASTCLILEGTMDLYLFEDDGSIREVLHLGAPASGRPFTVRVGPDEWHMPVCTTPQLVFFETMQGPFDRDAVNEWAPWSPGEDDAQGIREYLQATTPRE